MLIVPSVRPWESVTIAQAGPWRARPAFRVARGSLAGRIEDRPDQGRPPWSHDCNAVVGDGLYLIGADTCTRVRQDRMFVGRRGEYRNPFCPPPQFPLGAEF